MPRHLAFPIAVTGGQLATLEQDSPVEVAQSVALLLATEPGERQAVPDYGYPSPLGRGVNVEEVANLVAEWEERADPSLVEVTVTTLAEQRAIVYPGVPSSSTATTTDGES